MLLISAWIVAFELVAETVEGEMIWLVKATKRQKTKIAVLIKMSFMELWQLNQNDAYRDSTYIWKNISLFFVYNFSYLFYPIT